MPKTKASSTLTASGIEIVPTSRGLEHRIACTQCGRTAHKMLSDRTPPEIAVKKFKQAGWRPAKKPTCPDCLQTPTPSTNLEDDTMSDALTDNRSQPTYPAGDYVPEVMLSVMRQRSGSFATSLGIGLPSDWPWEYLRVTVDLDVGCVVVLKQGGKHENSRKLPVAPKPNSKRRWLEIKHGPLGIKDPHKPTGSWRATAYMATPECLRIDIPAPILSVLREAYQPAVAETVERNAGRPQAPEGEDRSLQDLRDARDMLNQALHDAAAAGHEVEAYVDGNRVGVRRYIRQSEDV
jgi:hypothetical protein